MVSNFCTFVRKSFILFTPFSKMVSVGSLVGMKALGSSCLGSLESVSLEDVS